MGKKGKIGKQRKDRFYHLAKETGYRSRAAFKLIQLNRKFEFLQKSKVLIDLCAAPGGWLQVAQKYMPVQSIILGVDLAPIKPIHNVITLQEDITTSKCRSLISKELKTWKVDVVLNDGAPNVGKSWIHDAFEQNRLTLSALHLACDFLIKGGWFVTKVFRSKDYNSLMWIFTKLFQRVHATKPQASRNESAEIFVVCQNYLAPDKIDPKFFDPTYVFAEVKPKEQKMTKSDLLNNSLKNKKPKAEGYEDGELLLYQKINATEFMQTLDYIDLLSKANEIVIDNESIKNHPSTTNEILECIKDLKVLGNKELKFLMNWRKSIREDLFEREPRNNSVKEDGQMELEKDEVEEIDTEQNEEAQKMKRKKRKISKEKKKLEERLKLKMIIKDDQLVQEEQDLFNLKNIKKASQLNFIKDVDPDHEDFNVVDLETESTQKRRKITYDKESESKFFDPDDSDADVSEDEDETNMSVSYNNNNQDDELGDENGILVNLEEKDDTTRNLTKMFFENKIFHQLESADLSNDEIGDDDDIELEELQNRISKVNKVKNPILDETKSITKIQNVKQKSVKFSNDDENEKSDSSASENEIDGDEGSVNGAPKILSSEELALGAMMIKSKKAKRDLLDNAWNRYVHEDDDMLPSWFRKEEQVYYRKPTPVSNEMVQEYNQKLKEINSKPIKKVMEAKARKKKRALRRLEKARLKAENVTDEPDMSNTEKAQYIRSIYKKALNKKQDKVQLVVGKKNYGNRRPPGVKGRYKMVDSRLKKDLRKQPKTKGKGNTKAKGNTKGKGRK